MAETTTPPAGWYPDGSDPAGARTRWWDGAQWTDRVGPSLDAQPGEQPVLEEKQKKKPRKALVISGAVLGGLILIGAIGAAVNGGAANETSPPLVNASQTPAAEELEEEDDAVAEEAPVVRVAIPDVVGQTAAEAATILTGIGVSPTYSGEPDAKVISMSPVAGSEVELGADVDLVLEEKPALTLAQQNAVGTAQDYLAYTGFSRSGLIGQLEYEGFTTEDATWAVDFVAPDWSAEAAETAQNYLDYTSFSREGLLDQLLYEGFSQAEAEYGVSAVGY